MPNPNSAVVQNYDFGAPPAVTAYTPSAEVLRFGILRGGRIDLTIVNTSTDTAERLYVTVQISADGSSWTSVTAAKNETLVVGSVSQYILPGCKEVVTVLLNAIAASSTTAGTTTSSGAAVAVGPGAFMRILACGTTTKGVRGLLQIRDAENKLSIVKI